MRDGQDVVILNSDAQLMSPGKQEEPTMLVAGMVRAIARTKTSGLQSLFHIAYTLSAEKTG